MDRVAFTKRPVPIPADYRPLYRIGQLLLILKLCCRANTASLLKLHLLHWGLKTERSRQVLLDLVQGTPTVGPVIWGFDPALNRALQFAVAEQVCQLQAGKYVLTEKGHRLVGLFLKDPDVYQAELVFLNLLGKEITEAKIGKLTHSWIKTHAEN